MNNNIGISYLDYYLPDNYMEVDKLLNEIKEDSIPETFKNKADYHTFVQSTLKIEKIYLSNEDEFFMISMLIDKMFDYSIVQDSEIDAVIFINEFAFTKDKDLQLKIREKYDFKNSLFLNISGNLCVNAEIALINSIALMNLNPNFKNILIIGTVQIKHLKNRLFDSYAIICDGAGLILINRNPIVILKDYAIVPHQKFASNNEKFFNHVQLSRKCLKSIIDRNKEVPIYKTLIHNANSTLMDFCLIGFQLDGEKIFKKNQSKGHYAYLDFIINLKDIIKDENTIEKYLLNFGLGNLSIYLSCILKVIEKNR